MKFNTSKHDGYEDLLNKNIRQIGDSIGVLTAHNCNCVAILFTTISVDGTMHVGLATEGGYVIDEKMEKAVHDIIDKVKKHRYDRDSDTVQKRGDK